jgi:penicillin amidase
LEVVTDTIFVKGGEPEVVELKFSRHGPVFFADTANHLAYALRSTMHEPGSTGYLAALRLNVVENCREFLDELRHWKAPTENMICGDADGNIGWQAAAASPRRDGWHGRLPVPGTGEYEWQGFRDDLPEEYNPERGWIGTANHDIHPPGYDPPLFFKSGTSFPRFERVAEVLSSATAFSVEDSRQLQLDAYSARAAGNLHLFRGWSAEDPDVEEARVALAEWDAWYRRDSKAAAIYSHVQEHLPTSSESENLGSEELRSMMTAALATALGELTESQGVDSSEWRWGRIQTSEFPHSLVGAYDLPSAERSGGAGTVAATGATYRHIIDFSNLDSSLATNAPGQSARPGSPYYGNLTESWSAGEYFPLLFTREAVEGQVENRLVLKPGG